jgi:hypothetical protein
VGVTEGRASVTESPIREVDGSTAEPPAPRRTPRPAGIAVCSSYPLHARIEVGRATVKVFVDGAARPTLVVNRLRTASGEVGLWVDSQEGSFAGLVLGGCG